MQLYTHSRRHFLTSLARLGLILVLLIVLLIQPAAPATAAAAPSAIPAAALRNADGTLNAWAGASGALDLAGFNVTLDAVRGPILSPAAAGDWSALGAG